MSSFTPSHHSSSEPLAPLRGLAAVERRNEAEQCARRQRRRPTTVDGMTSSRRSPRAPHERSSVVPVPDDRARRQREQLRATHRLAASAGQSLRELDDALSQLDHLVNDDVDREALPGRLLWKTDEAANALAISRSTLLTFIRSGELRPIKIGRATRFSQDELERFVKSRENSRTSL